MSHREIAGSGTGRKRRPGRRVGLLTAATLALLASSNAEARKAAPNITGVWRMVRPGETSDPRRLNPAIPPPPLTAAYAVVVEAQRRAMKAADDEGRPIARDRELCIPDGMPKMMTTDLPLEILQTPGQITLTTEFMSQTRRIALDRRQHPKSDDLPEGFFGDSIGRWEGEVLVVDTVGFKARTRLFNEVPHSDALHIVERIRLVAPDLLEDRITVNDPGVLTAPWVVTRLFLRRPDLRISESVCTENNRNYRDADGRLATRIP